MAKVIALFNNKGGVSKTTTCFNLGWMLTEWGKRVVMNAYPDLPLQPLRFLLEGPPKVGKTVAMRRLVELLRGAWRGGQWVRDRRDT